MAYIMLFLDVFHSVTTLELRYCGSARDQENWYAIPSVRYTGCVLYCRLNEGVRNVVHYVEGYVIQGAVISKFECTGKLIFFSCKCFFTPLL